MEKRKLLLICTVVCGLSGFGAGRKPWARADDTLAAPTAGLAIPIEKVLGQALLPWTLNDPKDWINCPAPIRLADLKGSIALVEIFRINCSHCQEAAPLIVAIHHRYGPRGLKIVAIQSPGDFTDPTNQENDWGAVKDWCADRDIDYPVAFDQDSQYFQKTMHGEYYPTTLLLGKDGKIIFAQTGHDSEKGLDLTVELEKALPGLGSLTDRAGGLAQWIATTPEYEGEGGPALTKEVLGKLQGNG